MAALKMLIISSFLLFAILGVESSVPVLLWGSESLSSLPIPLAGHSVSSNAFQKNYLEKLTPCQNCDKKNLVVFVQDKLSVEDFTHYGHVFEDTEEGGIFHNVKSYMGSHPSLTLSSVHLPADSINQLQKKFETVREVHLPRDDVSSVKPAGSNNLLVVHLPDTHGSGRVENNLKGNDGHISRILKRYSEAGVPYTAMYTARESSKMSTNGAVFAQGRHLLAAKNETGTVVGVKDCMLLYYKKASITLIPAGTKNTESVTTQLVGKPDSSKSECSNTSTANNIMVLTWANQGQNVSDITISMAFNSTKSGYWLITKMLLSYTSQNGSLSGIEMNGKEIFAWKGYSYHCTKVPKIMQNKRSNDTSRAHLVFEGFQIQPIALKKNKFGYANDCIGFFTIPIWSGLVTMLLLIGILSFGMYMMVMINTQDRFDDPKGKTITVTADDSK
ncbi:V-type proton ATPase subunit S1-like [Lineus longissimus]|uniref:V-type proton ATPase subunit S1-like n=1 Tax=Lineus longissimus TaxID=88925 RepID=UPI002B4C3E47